MKLMTSARMRGLDRHAIDILGIPSTLLMTAAARHVAAAALEILDGGPGPAAVFCGSGNNGGDGLAAAAILLRHGVKTRVFLTGPREKMTPDTVEMARRLGELGGTPEALDDTEDAEHYVNSCAVIIDAIFGIGLRAAPSGAALLAVRLINDAPAPVVAADIASGVEADTGRIPGQAVRADVTVTFTFTKPGHVVEPGCTCCGDLRVVGIGLPEELTGGAESDCFAVTARDITLPRRRRDTHKGDYGRVLILAGSVGLSGAPVLAARAASAVGAGLVSLGVPESIYTIAASRCDGEMVFPLPSTPEGLMSADALPAVLDRLSRCDVCLVGPGLGRSPESDDIVRAVLGAARVPLILDADGLNAIAGNIHLLDEAAAPLILTPHPGEFARLGGDLSDGRLDAARRFARQHACILALKGHRTITALPDGTAYVNTTGGPAMARGGMGDLLAGMIASFAGQGFPLRDAVLAAVYLHGRAGDLCADRRGEYSATVGAVLDTLPEALREAANRP